MVKNKEGSLSTILSGPSTTTKKNKMGCWSEPHPNTPIKNKSIKELGPVSLITPGKAITAVFSHMDKQAPENHTA